MSNVKKYILDQCFTKKGSLNNRSCLLSWWANKGDINIYNTIIDDTKFLPIDCLYSERLYSITHDIPNRQTCQVCKVAFVKFNSYKEGYYRYCSTYCSTQSMDRNDKISKSRQSIDKKKMVEKMVSTNMSRYGVKFTTQDVLIQKKTRKTKLERYGNETYNNLDKAKETNLAKYGTEYTCLAESVMAKSKDTIMNRTPQLFDSDWLIHNNKTKTLSEMSSELGVTYRTVWLAFDRLGLEPIFYRPKYNRIEKDIHDFITKELEYTGDVRINDRTIIGPKELDIYIPDRNLSIELNGIYWHSYDSRPTTVEKNRHLHKRNLCIEKNIKLLQIWDTEWIEKNHIIKDIIRRSLGLSKRVIYARNTSVRHVTSEASNKFLSDNHIQSGKNARYRYGLYTKEDELVSIMTFSRPRFDTNTDYEMIRFCSKSNIHIIGGIKKLYAAFIKELQPNSVISYSDRRFFAGESYMKLGFEKSSRSDTTIDYFWVKNNQIINRLNTQKHKLSALLGNKNFDVLLSEDENLFKNKYRKLYGCGHDTWIYRKKGEQ